MPHSIARERRSVVGSPDIFDAFVEPECRVGGDDRDVLGQCLRDNLPVEGIAMVEGQVEEFECVAGVPGQHLHPEIGKAHEDIFAMNIKLALAVFDGNLGNGECAEFAYGVVIL